MTKFPQLWGGLECTVNRVHEHYGDQIRLSGHQDRLEDLDRFAELGIRAIRYPVLWERTSPDHPDQCDWAWSDQRLSRLRELGIRVIAGLIHHGSGPRYTLTISPKVWPLMPAMSPNAIPGSKTGRPSTSP